MLVCNQEKGLHNRYQWTRTRWVCLPCLGGYYHMASWAVVLPHTAAGRFWSTKPASLHGHYPGHYPGHHPGHYHCHYPAQCPLSWPLSVQLSWPLSWQLSWPLSSPLSWPLSTTTLSARPPCHVVARSKHHNSGWPPPPHKQPKTGPKCRLVPATPEHKQALTMVACTHTY